ncbi:MAG: M1 family metallopeptidase [Ferruginibacter sp.]
MLKYFIWIFISIIISSGSAKGQLGSKKDIFTKKDSLRGMNGPFRQKWDVLHYDITVQPDFESKTIKGNNRMRFYDNGANLMQVDLQEPMILDSVVNNNGRYNFTRDGNVYWVMLRDTNRMYKIKPQENFVTLYFHGKPVEAKRPPWDGGWIWKKDQDGNPWMSVACQGLGASVWYPCKDIQSDKPDSGATLHIIVPDSLIAVGNGRMISTTKNNNSTTTYTWSVKNPINNYNIVPYIGKYSHFSEVYNGEKGKLDMDYWVLTYDLEKAKYQFKDAPKMMKAFEHWFGPYPFYEDGYKLVEAPHLGMEHQSAIAYGNGFKMGYSGRDLSGTGWGLKWDFIIVHESGHEWFANNITTNDIADMWVHEGFTNYSETLFTGYYFGQVAGNAYVQGTRKLISNDIPIIGPYGVNKEGSGDMYYKAGNMLHIIRQIINDDEKFRSILRGLNKDFYHQTVTTQQVETYLEKKSGKKLSKIFDQYLRTSKVPVLEYKLDGKKLLYRWSNVVEGFDMPLKISLDGLTFQWIKVATSWKRLKVGKDYDQTKFLIDSNFYVTSKF